MIVPACHWRGFADSALIARERRRRWPGSEPNHGRSVCTCGEQLGPVTGMCLECHSGGWAWTATVFRETRGGA